MTTSEIKSLIAETLESENLHMLTVDDVWFNFMQSDPAFPEIDIDDAIQRSLIRVSGLVV